MKSLIFILFIPFCLVYSQGINDWETHSYMNDVKDILYYDNHIWTATTGGVYKFNIQDSTFQKFTNIDGLSSLNLSTLTADNYGNIIFGSIGGNISIYNLQFNIWNSLNDLEGKNITDIYVYGDTLWIASNSGIGVFLYNNYEYEFRDFYNSFPIGPENSRKILVFNNKVYFATNNGLLYASSNFIKTNLKSSENWSVHNTSDVLPNNDVRTLAIVKDTLYIGTADGVTRFAKDGVTDNAFNWNAGVVNNIALINDTLYFFREGDFYNYSNGIWKWLKGYGIFIQSIVKDNNNNLWLALQNNGLINWNWDSSFKLDGPGSNHVGIITKDLHNNLWISAGKFKLTPREGFYKFDFINWRNYKFAGGSWVWKNQTDYIYCDKSGNIWIGSWPGGIAVISDTSMLAYHKFPEAGQLIISEINNNDTIYMPPISAQIIDCLSNARIGGTDLHLVITNFIEDNNGNMFLSNYIADDLNFITVIPRLNNILQLDDCSNWMYFGSNIGMQFYEGQISSMVFDNFGRLWVGTYENKLLIIDFNETLANPSDDVIYRIGLEDGLYSNTILHLAKDQDDIMWIGTAAGLNSYDGQNFYKHVGETGPIENKINYIFVDDFNNKWFATDGGLSILEGDKSPWEESAWSHYTPENSGLANEIVNSVYVDSDKGEAYIGTEGGLSIFKGAFSEIRSNFDLLIGGPNPFFIDNDSGVFTLKNLAFNSTVKILNINGELVRVLSEENGLIQGSRAQWDGRDSNNNLVASGIYIYLVYTEEGVTGKGKLSVIRK
jgi:ligand-binding sensor domain-containing protein